MVFNYVLTVLTAFFISLGALGKKYSNAHVKREKFLNISAFSLLIAAAMWIVFAFTGDAVNGTVVLFSAVFAVNFIVCNFTLYAAMELGSLSKTNLFNSLSLVIPTLAGIVFWHEEFNIFMLCGAMALMIASLLLIILKAEPAESEEEKEKRRKSKAKWVIFNLIAFFTNGLSSIIQKWEQTVMDGQGAFSMTALSFTFVAVFAFAVYLVCALVGKCPLKDDFNALLHNKKDVLFNAVGLGEVNLAVTYLSTRIPGAFLFPCVLGGSVIITTVFSAVFFKEKLNARVIVGILLGVAAIVIFSL